ncbi:hypothetical protein [Streptomyces sp. NPDC086766]|uniref:hypothetical protein n=1 Tax=Streptomyces sp. NPDC086766 TaxID=3365754 RepID=UPI003807CC1E
MIGHLCHTAEKGDPTLVLDRRALPGDERELAAALLLARDWLTAAQGIDITTIAMIEPSADPEFDLDHRFARYLPGSSPRFALRGSCGHAILCSVAVAQRLAWLPRHTAQRPLRVKVLNTGDRVECEVDGTGRTATFAVEFAYRPPRRLRDLLPTGTPREELDGLTVSMVSAGNPHVLVDAADLGLHDQESLFAAGPAVRRRLAGLRRGAARRLGLPEDGAFPGIAAVGQYQYRRLAVLPLPAPGATDPPSGPDESAPLAPADAITVAAAAVIEGTVAQRLATRGWSRADELVVDTPGGTTVVRLAVSGTAGDDTLTRARVRRRTIRYAGPVLLEPLRGLMLTPQDAPRPLALR